MLMPIFGNQRSIQASGHIDIVSLDDIFAHFFTFPDMAKRVKRGETDGEFDLCPNTAEVHP